MARSPAVSSGSRISREVQAVPGHKDSRLEWQGEIPDLEKLYAFARLLRRYLPVELDHLPREIQEKIDMESYRVQRTWRGKIKLERGEGEPIGAEAARAA